MGTFTFTAGATRHAVASVTVELTDWLLGVTYLGPAYDLQLPGGGYVSVDGLGNNTINLSGGGRLSAQGRNPDHPFVLSGGGQANLEGQPLGIGLHAVGRHAAKSTVSVTGGGAVTFNETVLTGLGSGIAITGGGAVSVAAVHRARGFLLDVAGGTIAGLGSAYVALTVPCAELLIETGSVTLGPPAPPAPAGLVLSLLDDTLDASPSSLIAFVGNGTPAGIATFEISDGTTSVEVLFGRFDESGAIGGISVPVDVVAEGSYELIVTDVTFTLTATASFTVAAITTAATIGVPVTTPPSPVQPSVGVKKWVFQDPATSDVYTFPISPSKANSPHGPKRITFAATTAINGTKLAFEGQAAPVDWKFEGVLFDKSQYDAFVYWLGKRNRIWVTDHFGRAWLVYLTSFEPVARRATNHPWCHDYTMSAIIFEGPVTPA